MTLWTCGTWRRAVLTRRGWGRRGQCYILSGRHYMVHQVLSMVRREGGVRRLPVLPLWLARAAAPLLEWWARRRGRRPLYTRYSLYTLSSNDRFSHDKATAELRYRPRDLRETVHDTGALGCAATTSSCGPKRRGR